MGNNVSVQVRAAVLLFGVLALAVTACGGSGDTDSAGTSTGAQASEPAQAESQEAEASAAVDGFASLQERADTTTEVTLASGGRLMVGVFCIEGYSNPTALLEVFGQGIPAGTHDAQVEPSIGTKPRFIVLDTDQPQRPANTAVTALQTRFDAPEYTISYASLGDEAVLALPGCS